MKKINLDQWNRKGLDVFFKDFDYPKYSITVDLDVTGYLNYVKKHQLSFYYSMIHLVLGEMRTIPNFLYRIKDQDVYLVDDIHPSFTDAIKDSDLFKIVNTSYVETSRRQL